jgi:hypothetical protein
MALLGDFCLAGFSFSVFRITANLGGLETLARYYLAQVGLAYQGGI